MELVMTIGVQDPTTEAVVFAILAIHFVIVVVFSLLFTFDFGGKNE